MMSNSSSSSSANAVANNEDVMSEILVRLPPKSLLRFKCVSKQWLSLISSSQFIASHIRHHGTPDPSGLLLLDYLPGPGSHYIPLRHSNDNGPPYLSYIGDPGLQIEQSCNGLLLCSSECTKVRKSVVKGIDVDIRYYVCNPTSRQFKALPRPCPLYMHHMHAVNLAFDPSHSPHFKVVRILRSNVDSDHSLDIYESQTDTWKCPTRFSTPLSTYFQDPVFCRGAIHWFSWDNTSLYFDVDRECLYAMPMPPFQNYGYLRYFGESRGRLNLILSKTFESVEFDVLELEEDYSAWAMRYHVNLDSLRIAFSLKYQIPSNQFLFSILTVAEEEREEESEVILFVLDMVVSYRFKDGSLQMRMQLSSCEDAEDHDSDQLVYNWGNVYPFIQTLCHI